MKRPLIQLEIGVQSTNEKTLAELRARRAEELAAEETVMDFQNIEQ